MRKVDFFIVGAPKCGTTTLALNLDKHPDIIISNPKEPHYFSSDLDTGISMASSDEAYLKKFYPDNVDDNNLLGDASVWYLYSEEAIKRIKAYNSQAKIIILLRNPAKAAFSLHQQMIFENQEDDMDFHSAWRKSDSRFNLLKYPKKMTLDPKLVAYKHVFSFYDQIKRVYRYFPEKQILILKQEDMRSNSSKILSDVFKFLNLKPINVVFTNANKSFYLKNKFMATVLRTTFLKSSISLFKKLLMIKSFSIGRPSMPFLDSYSDLVNADLIDELEHLREFYKIDYLNQ